MHKLRDAASPGTVRCSFKSFPMVIVPQKIELWLVSRSSSSMQCFFFLSVSLLSAMSSGNRPRSWVGEVRKPL